MLSGYHLTVQVYFRALLKRYDFQEAPSPFRLRKVLGRRAMEGSEGQRGLVMASLGGSQASGEYIKQEDAGGQGPASSNHSSGYSRALPHAPDVS